MIISANLIEIIHKMTEAKIFFGLQFLEIQNPKNQIIWI